MRKAGQYCVQVYDTELEKLKAAGMVAPISEDIQDFYELVDKNQYTEDMGLNLDVDFGMGVIWQTDKTGGCHMKILWHPPAGKL